MLRTHTHRQGLLLKRYWVSATLEKFHTEFSYFWYSYIDVPFSMLDLVCKREPDTEIAIFKLEDFFLFRGRIFTICIFRLVQLMFLGSSKFTDVHFCYFLCFFFQDAIKEEAFFRSLFKEFQNLSKTKMSVKSQAIEMIPLLLQNCSEKQTRIVCQELRSFITNTFPLSSTDLTVGSTQYVEYVTLLSQVRMYFSYLS